ncbi:Isoprenoid synthase domain containing protein [Tylopilus felleus]
MAMAAAYQPAPHRGGEGIRCLDHELRSPLIVGLSNSEERTPSEHFRTCCDFINMVFVVDDHLDASEPTEAERQKEITMDAFYNPHKPRPKGEWIGGEMTRQFWELAIQNATKQSQKRFVNAFDGMLQGMLQQAIDRSHHRIRDIESFIELRRNTIGAKPAFALLELGLEIPDEVISHPAIQQMDVAAIDMVAIANDVVSYNVEQSRGDDNHNLIKIVMKELGTDVNGAMLWVQDLHAKVEQRFHAAMAALPEWDEPLNSQVKEYCDGLGNWVRGNYEWNFESGRYLGNRGMVIKENRWMALMPKCQRVEPVGPVLVDDSLL